MFARVLTIVFLGFNASLMLCVAAVLWNDSRRASSYNDTSSLSVNPLRFLLSNGEIKLSDPEVYKQIATNYIQKRPLDPQGWLWKSDFSHRAAEATEAGDFLKVAHLLSRNNAALLSKVFNRYAEYNDLRHATAVARDLIYANPYKMDRYVYFMSRLRDDYTELVNELIPSSMSTHFELSTSFYYSKTIRLAIKLDNIDFADAVWSATPKTNWLNSKSGLEYARYLSRKGQVEKMQQAWGAVIGTDLSIGSIVDGSFESIHLENTLCWEVANVKGATTVSSDNSINGGYSLAIKFDGSTNLDYKHALCTITVEPNQQYVLSGKWAGEALTTLSGPFIDVVSIGTGKKKIYAKSEVLNGSWPWQKFDLRFKAPDDVTLMQIRLRRSRTLNLDNQIAGTVWFDDFNLVAEQQSQTSLTHYQSGQYD